MGNAILRDMITGIRYKFIVLCGALMWYGCDYGPREIVRPRRVETGPISTADLVCAGVYRSGCPDYPGEPSQFEAAIEGSGVGTIFVHGFKMQGWVQRCFFDPETNMNTCAYYYDTQYASLVAGGRLELPSFQWANEYPLEVYPRDTTMIRGATATFSAYWTEADEFASCVRADSLYLLPSIRFRATVNIDANETYGWRDTTIEFPEFKMWKDTTYAGPAAAKTGKRARAAVLIEGSGRP